jgi:hypothetical protein
MARVIVLKKGGKKPHENHRKMDEHGDLRPKYQ